jgi:thioesterase domain-containing protein
LVAIQPKGSLPPIFAMPGGHGDVLYLRHLAVYLSDNQPFYGLQTLYTDKSGFITIEDIAKIYISEIKVIQPQGPYLLAGHSFGGYVALEMARQLKSAGESVALLALWDTHPPGPRQQASAFDRVRLHLENLGKLTFSGKISYFLGRFEALVIKSSRYTFARKILKRAGYKPRKTLATSQLAKYFYDPRPYDGNMVFFKASERPWYIRWDPMKNWNRYVTGQIRVYTVSGDHGSLMQEPHVKELAAYLNECISELHASAK